jgi:hypothetical protein
MDEKSKKDVEEDPSLCLVTACWKTLPFWLEKLGV